MIYRYLSLELIVCAAALGLLALDAFGVKGRRLLANLAGAALVAAGLAGLTHWGVNRSLLGGSYVLDTTSLFFKEVILLITFVSIMISVEYVRSELHHSGEFYALVMFVCTGMLFLVSAGDLVTVFISLELTSMPLYVLAASLKYNRRSSEAGMKFFLLGAVASAFYLFGAALVFGSLGTMYIREFPRQLAQATGGEQAAFLGMICIIAAFGFKIAAAPFHMWAPDVYQGAPTVVTAFLSTAPKAAGVAILMRFLMNGFYVAGPALGVKPDWVLVVSVLALLSMTVGNLVAMHQTSIKRMMAYSGIAHMGYILTGVAAASVMGDAAVMFYVLLYALTTLGAWGVIIIYGLAVGSDEIQDFAGMAKRAPGLAVMLLLAFLSLAGLPPLAGFIGKFYLFASAWEAGLPWLAVFGIVNSVASLFYYLGVLRLVYFREPASMEPIPLSANYSLAYSISMLAIVFLGLFPATSEWVFTVATAFVHP